MPTRVYIQSEYFSDIKLVEIDDHATIDALKVAVFALLPAGTDTSELMLSVEDDDDDRANRAKHVKDLKKEHGVHLHLHRCKQVGVTVQFGAETIQHPFNPATTIARVRQWAGKELGMQPGDLAEHVLQIAGTTEQPDMDTHIGSLTTCPACAVKFDLVPAHRING